MNDLSPIYTQIVRYVKIRILRKEVANGEELPSRRILSATLGVNPNTIQKAYRIMEEEGFIVTYLGSKSILRFDDAMVETIREDLLSAELSTFISEVKKMGYDRDKTCTLIREFWEKY
ncbi:MAG: GntR family transcriptional regulator [Oscillospiraceae bacterium]|nr:GntR family transcriptional regulator [Oscillospiraceae bacterium]